MLLNRFKIKIARIFEILFHFIPMRNEQIMFVSFEGQYNDNPKYISEAIHSISEKYKLIWVISDKCHEKALIPKYIKCVKKNSFKYIIEKNRASILVDNGVGWYFRNSTIRYYKHLRKKGQFNLSTWHGTPLKKIGRDMHEHKDWTVDSVNTTSDLLIAGSKYAADIFKSAFLNKMDICILGTPRNDLLVNATENDKIRLRNKLNLPKDVKLILYAPTFRDNPDDSGVKQIQSFNLNALFSSMHEKFGGTWKIVFRIHNMVLGRIQGSEILSDDRVIDGNAFDDMIEYMVACDILITDYSGALFDNAITSTPCFLFAHDKEHYSKIERGLYMNIEELPYSFAETFNDLIKNISEFDQSEAEHKRKKFLKLIGNAEDGKAATRVANLILNKTEGIK